MIENVKRILLISLIVLGLIVVYKTPKILINKNNEPLPEVKLKEIVNKNKSFAIMIQEKSETDKYQEYSSNKWPEDDYKFKEAKCIDNIGNELKEAVTYENGKIILTTNKTVYCTVYFDKSIIGKLRENDLNKNISIDLQGGMYRYQGTDDVHNWICFGTTDNCGANETDSDEDSIPDGIDKYMYRIIGVTKEGQLYLLKETFLKEGTSAIFSWNDKYYASESSARTCNDKVCPEWNMSLLFKRINGTTNGITQGVGTTSDNANTDIFVDSEYYNYLQSGDENGTNDRIGNEWYQLIADHDWMYGDIGRGCDTLLNTYNGDTVYAIETGQADTKHYVGIDGNNEEKTYKWNKETGPVKAKISLMYIHDYYYGYYDGSTAESRGNAGDGGKSKKSWMFFQKDGYNTLTNNEWLSTRLGLPSSWTTNVLAFQVHINGEWSAYDLYFGNGVRPVFYLKNDIKIADGTGTKTNPYILEIKES